MSLRNVEIDVTTPYAVGCGDFKMWLSGEYLREQQIREGQKELMIYYLMTKGIKEFQEGLGKMAAEIVRDYALLPEHLQEVKTRINNA